VLHDAHEIGLYSDAGHRHIRSTSFYGLLVRARHGSIRAWISYFAYTQAALSLQQNVNLPASQSRRSSSRVWWARSTAYQLVGPPHFG